MDTAPAPRAIPGQVFFVMKNLYEYFGRIMVLLTGIAIGMAGIGIPLLVPQLHPGFEVLGRMIGIPLLVPQLHPGFDVLGRMIFAGIFLAAGAFIAIMGVVGELDDY